MKLESPEFSGDNLILFSAGSGTEISNSLPDKRHGLFTYFFLKGLQGQADINSDGMVTLAELYSYLAPQVKKTARNVKKQEQSPNLQPGTTSLGARADLPMGKVAR